MKNSKAEKSRKRGIAAADAARRKRFTEHQAMLHWQALTRARAEELRMIGLDKSAERLEEWAEEMRMLPPAD